MMKSPPKGPKSPKSTDTFDHLPRPEFPDSSEELVLKKKSYASVKKGPAVPPTPMKKLVPSREEGRRPHVVRTPLAVLTAAAVNVPPTPRRSVASRSAAVVKTPTKSASAAAAASPSTPVRSSAAAGAMISPPTTPGSTRDTKVPQTPSVSTGFFGSPHRTPGKGTAGAGTTSPGKVALKLAKQKIPLDSINPIFVAVAQAATQYLVSNDRDLLLARNIVDTIAETLRLMKVGVMPEEGENLGWLTACGQTHVFSYDIEEPACQILRAIIDAAWACVIVENSAHQEFRKFLLTQKNLVLDTELAQAGIVVNVPSMQMGDTKADTSADVKAVKTGDSKSASELPAANVVTVPQPLSTLRPELDKLLLQHQQLAANLDALEMQRKELLLQEARTPVYEWQLLIHLNMKSAEMARGFGIIFSQAYQINAGALKLMTQLEAHIQAIGAGHATPKMADVAQRFKALQLQIQNDLNRFSSLGGTIAVIMDGVVTQQKKVTPGLLQFYLQNVESAAMTAWRDPWVRAQQHMGKGLDLSEKQRVTSAALDEALGTLIPPSNATPTFGS